MRLPVLEHDGQTRRHVPDAVRSRRVHRVAQAETISVCTDDGVAALVTREGQGNPEPSAVLRSPFDCAQGEPGVLLSQKDR